MTLPSPQAFDDRRPRIHVIEDDGDLEHNELTPGTDADVSWFTPTTPRGSESLSSGECLTASPQAPSNPETSRFPQQAGLMEQSARVVQVDELEDVSEGYPHTSSRIASKDELLREGPKHRNGVRAKTRSTISPTIATAKQRHKGRVKRKFCVPTGKTKPKASSQGSATTQNQPLSRALQSLRFGREGRRTYRAPEDGYEAASI